MVKKNKKILFLHSSNDLYGSSKVLIKVINLLSERGFEIFLILPYTGPLDNILKNRAIIFHKNLGVLRKKYFNLFGLLNRIKKIFNSVLYINKIIKDHTIDIIYTNTSVIISGGISASLNSKESYFHIHEIPKNQFYLIISRKIIDWTSNKIILVSKSVKNHWNFSKSSKIKLIYNGFSVIDNLDQKKINKKLVFTSIGRLIPYKGHLYLLKIAKELKDLNKQFTIYIIGDTFSGYEKYESFLKKFVVKNDLINNIFFIGFTKDINRYLKKSDFLIHTTIEPDPLPTVIIEAILLNIPIIATNLGGSVEILDYGLGGLLIPENNAKKSVSLILDHLNNKKNILEKKKHARNHLKKFFSESEFNYKILSLFNN